MKIDSPTRSAASGELQTRHERSHARSLAAAPGCKHSCSNTLSEALHCCCRRHRRHHQLFPREAQAGGRPAALRANANL